MTVGKYYAFQRTNELDSTFKVFTNNLQVWLSLFAFSSLIVVEAGKAIWGWWNKVTEITPWGWFAYIVGSVVVIIFVAMGLFTFIKSAILLWNGKFGQLVEYNSQEDLNVLKAIKPIENTKDLEQYRDFLKKLIEENNKLITEYYSIINRLEDKSVVKNESGGQA